MGYQRGKSRKNREEKVSKENKTGKNQQAGGVQGCGDTRGGTVAYGFFKQAAAAVASR